MVKKGIPNEDRLIFLSDRTKVNVSTQQRIKKLLDNPLDWNKIIKISHQHQILPLLYCTLNELKLSNIVPQDTFSILKKSYYLNLVRNTRLWHEFLSVLKSANGSGLKIALLKGISLIKTVYHNPALRIITDIDILIKEAEMLKLKNILLQLDYQENSKDFTTKKYYERHKISFDFSKQISPNLYLLLEVHRGLAPQRPYKINLPHIWKRIEEKTIDGQRVAFLSPEDTFLSLVLHLRQNTRNLLLKFICDTAELLNQCGHRFDWD